MSNNQFTLLLDRPCEDETSMVIRFETTTELGTDKDAILKAFQTSIENWVRCSNEGKQCFGYAGTDLNIGDIASYHPRRELNECLAANGILNFAEVEQPMKFPDWNYDTSLCPFSKSVEIFWIPS